MKDSTFLETCVQDVRTLLSDAEPVEYGPDAFDDPDVVMLWDGNGRRAVDAGMSYTTSVPVAELRELYGDPEDQQ
jgi:CRISPR-associated protein Cas1